MKKQKGEARQKVTKHFSLSSKMKKAEDHKGRNLITHTGSEWGKKKPTKIR